MRIDEVCQGALGRHCAYMCVYVCHGLLMFVNYCNYIQTYSNHFLKMLSVLFRCFLRLFQEYEIWCDAHASVDENAFEEEHVMATVCATTPEDDGQLVGTDKECYELLKQLKAQSTSPDSKCPTNAASELLVKDDISDEGGTSVVAGRRIFTLSALFEKLQRKSIISQASLLAEMWALVVVLREGPGCDGMYIKNHRASVASAAHSYIFLSFAGALKCPVYLCISLIIPACRILQT